MRTTAGCGPRRWRASGSRYRRPQNPFDAAARGDCPWLPGQLARPAAGRCGNAEPAQPPLGSPVGPHWTRGGAGCGALPAQPPAGSIVGPQVGCVPPNQCLMRLQVSESVVGRDACGESAGGASSATAARPGRMAAARTMARATRRKRFMAAPLLEATSGTAGVAAGRLQESWCRTPGNGGTREMILVTRMLGDPGLSITGQETSYAG